MLIVQVNTPTYGTQYIVASIYADDVTIMHLFNFQFTMTLELWPQISTSSPYKLSISTPLNATLKKPTTLHLSMN